MVPRRRREAWRPEKKYRKGQDCLIKPAGLSFTLISALRYTVNGTCGQAIECEVNVMYYIGIDLGTSAVKLLLADEKGAIVNSVTKEYPLIFPHPGWSEQDPGEWWKAVTEGIGELLSGFACPGSW